MPEKIAYYTAATVLVILLMITMVIHILNYSGFNKKQKFWFTSTFAVITFCALAEYAIQCGYYNDVFKIPLTILTILQFAAAPCVTILFAGALGLRHQKKILPMIQRVILIPLRLQFYMVQLQFFLI